MNIHLRQLIDISNLDKEIDSLEPLIREKRKDLDKALSDKELKQTESLNLEEEKGALKLQVSKNEQTLHDTNAKIASIQKKMSEIKSERELRSLNIEEDIAKERSSQANREIENLQNEIKHKSERQEILKQEILELEKLASELEGSVENEVQYIKDSQQKIFKKKQDLVEKMEPKIHRFYERIRRWAKNTSIVTIKKQACGGCFIRLNDRTYSEVLTSGDIVVCPHCGRILYAESLETQAPNTKA
ncbi:zinc ribbon domain-containing protein [Helicobacter cetorum]|uniref:zinc ribbon domain-containing protein n=1 Tax=Helicobacter cetorum TaxID=138563 RepID=UPI000CF0EA53|nr:zinc ribbon domain-containing protein [Helicobacter cetorum]